MSKLDNFLSHMFGNDKKKFKEVNIEREVLEEIMEISKESYPHEFAALLQGKIKNEILHIDGLIFLPGETSSEGAVMQILMLPPMTGAVGSVHSHPGPGNYPSQADFMFFAKNGLFHMIIAQPYILDSIAAYDTFGELTEFNII